MLCAVRTEQIWLWRLFVVTSLCRRMAVSCETVRLLTHVLVVKQVFVILDEYILAGEVMETSKPVILGRIHAIDRLLDNS